MKKIKTYLESQLTEKTVKRLAIVVLIFLAFWGGTQVGYRKAGFEYHFGERYYNAFGPEKGHEGGRQMMQGDVPGGHGAIGKIVSLTPPTLVIENRDNTERVIRLDDKTLYKKLRGPATVADLAVGDFIVVIGSPNTDSEIDARFVRIMPPPPNTSTETTTTPAN